MSFQLISWRGSPKCRQVLCGEGLWKVLLIFFGGHRPQLFSARMCWPACLEPREIKSVELLGNGGDLRTSLLMASSLVSGLVATATDKTNTQFMDYMVGGFLKWWYLLNPPWLDVFFPRVFPRFSMSRLFPAPSDPQWFRAAGEQAAQQILERYRRTLTTEATSCWCWWFCGSFFSDSRCDCGETNKSVVRNASHDHRGDLANILIYYIHIYI